MNKNTMGALAFSLLAMFTGLQAIFIVQTAVVHASLFIASCFGVVGTIAFLTISVCAYIVYQEGRQKPVTIQIQLSA
jgi:tryptophan-rich sensory protein